MAPNDLKWAKNDLLAKDSEFLTNSAIETQKTQKFGVNSEILTPLEPLVQARLYGNLVMSHKNHKIRATGETCISPVFISLTFLSKELMRLLCSGAWAFAKLAVSFLPCHWGEDPPSLREAIPHLLLCKCATQTQDLWQFSEKSSHLVERHLSTVARCSIALEGQ